MEKDMTAVEKDGRATLCTSKTARSDNSKRIAKVNRYLIRREYRKQCVIGLQEFKTMAYEELYLTLANFAHEQWQQLPAHASQWERGQVDGLFWALDKLDEIVIK